jgi:hypothetical protein
VVYEDKRNWPEYNDQLVRRGWFYLSTGSLEHWDEELENMNRGKSGRPFKFPDTFIQEKHGVERRGWIKVHVVVDVKTRKPITFRIIGEKTADHEITRPLLENINPEDALMDGAYDKGEVFKFLNGKGVNLPGIKVRKNAIYFSSQEDSFAGLKPMYPYLEMFSYPITPRLTSKLALLEKTSTPL